jgi:septal ring-binding cell division protein DamX
VPLYLGGGLAALAVIGVILAIVALASRNDVVAGNPTPTPSASAVPPGATSTTPPLPTGTPLPSVTPSPSATVDPNASPTTTPDPNLSPSPTADATESATPSPTATEDPGTTDDGGTGDTGTGSTFPGWTGADGDYTIIVESAKSKSGAEKVAQKAQDAGESPGILESSNYSNLNGGYWVVFIGTYSSKSEAQDALDGVRSTFKDAYVRQIKQ